MKGKKGPIPGIDPPFQDSGIYPTPPPHPKG